jgi:3' terminal RNA ribose 2'-O-methyltransferase Hen1
MLFTITCLGEHAHALGFLLHKNPARPQTVELNYGRAHIFYPDAQEGRYTAALLLDINPIDLAKGSGLFDYVNDRPYAASSLLSVAISNVYGTAMSGRCKTMPEMVSVKLPLTAMISALPSAGGEEVIAKLFEPLGYTVKAENFPLDPAFPEWGASRYYDLSLSAQITLSEMLTHLYVLIPVLDNNKHYWIGEDEVTKLLKHGEGWLQKHPMKEYITSRYLKRRKYLIHKALAMLNEGEESAAEEQETEQEKEQRLSLNQRRLGSVEAALKNIGAKRVLDLGCGEGHLLAHLLRDQSFTEIAGMDVSFTAIEHAKERLHFDTLSERNKERLKLFQGSLFYKDKRLLGYDACAVVEVIEHLDEARLSAFEKVVFGYINPPAVTLTTPNREYNDNYSLQGAMRHSDHRFEWTRGEFRKWAKRVALEYGYTVTFSDIGDIDPELGSPTQMAVFIK